MKAKFRKIAQIVAGLGLAALVILLVVGVWRWYASLPQQLAATIGGLQQRASASSRLERGNASETRNANSALSEQEMVDAFIELNPQLTVWASDGCLASIQFMAMASSPSGN